MSGQEASQEDAGADAKTYTALYLGYASNLSPKTMRQRCPESLYVGIGYVEDWKFAITTLGFGNIVRSPGDVVYGGLYFLTARDENALDRSEGVPFEYEREMVEVVRCGEGLGEAQGQRVKALTYIDFKDLEAAKSAKFDEDYVFYIIRAIEDGLKCGIPASYFDKYVKPITPKFDRGFYDMNMVRMGQ